MLCSIPEIVPEPAGGAQRDLLLRALHTLADEGEGIKEAMRPLAPTLAQASAPCRGAYSLSALLRLARTALHSIDAANHDPPLRVQRIREAHPVFLTAAFLDPRAPHLAFPDTRFMRTSTDAHS